MKSLDKTSSVELRIRSAHTKANSKNYRTKKAAFRHSEDAAAADDKNEVVGEEGAKDDATKDKLKSILLSVNIFTDLNTEQLDLIIDAMRKVSVTPGDVIYKKDDDAFVFYAVETGSYIKGEAGLSDRHFGEAALLFQGKRAETITATAAGNPNS